MAWLVVSAAYRQPYVSSNIVAHAHGNFWGIGIVAGTLVCIWYRLGRSHVCNNHSVWDPTAFQAIDF